MRGWGAAVELERQRPAPAFPSRQHSSPSGHARGVRKKALGGLLMTQAGPNLAPLLILTVGEKSSKERPLGRAERTCGGWVGGVARKSWWWGRPRALETSQPPGPGLGRGSVGGGDKFLSWWPSQGRGLDQRWGLCL